MSKCVGCPFNDGLTEEATIGQNYGCLPTGLDNIEYFDRNQKSIGCHDNDKHCRGLLEARPAAKTQPVVSYHDWYHNPNKDEQNSQNDQNEILQRTTQI